MILLVVGVICVQPFHLKPLTQVISTMLLIIQKILQYAKVGLLLFDIMNWEKLFDPFDQIYLVCMCILYRFTSNN